MNCNNRELLAALSGCGNGSLQLSVHGEILKRGEFERQLRNAGLMIAEKAYGAHRLHTPHCRTTSYETSDSGLWFELRTFTLPDGELTERKRKGPDGSMWYSERAVKTKEDMHLLMKMFAKAEPAPDFGAISETIPRLGDDGIVVCRLPRSPLQSLYVEWMGPENTILALHDYPESFRSLLEAISDINIAIAEYAADSPAKVVWSAENITSDLTSPALYREFLLPYYSRLTEIFNAKSKLHGVHMDGMLQALVENIRETKLDFIEGFTPPPMGNLTAERALVEWPGKSLWINIPGSIFHESHPTAEMLIRNLVSSVADSGRAAFTIAEDLPDVQPNLEFLTNLFNKIEEPPKRVQL